jgi:hypothetical protein
MSTVVRKFSAAPVRTASNTWLAITNVLAPQTGEVKSAFLSIAGVAASLIAEGTPEKSPITVIGKGARLRIYCLYDEDGSTEDSNESALNWDLFDSDWKVFLPADKTDLEWIQRALAGIDSRFKVYEVGTNIPTEGNEVRNTSNSTGNLSIDISKL